MTSLADVSVTLRLELTFIVLTTVLVVHLWRIYRGRALQELAIGWALWSLRFLFAATTSLLMTAGTPAHSPLRRILTTGAMLSSVCSAVFLCRGTLAVAGIEAAAVRPWRRALMYGAPAAIIALVSTGPDAAYWWRVALLLMSSTVVPIGVFGYIAWRLLRHKRDDLTAGRRLAAFCYLTFIARQLYNIALFLDAGAPSTSPDVYAETVVYAVVVVGTIALLLERERERGVAAVHAQRRLEGELAARDRLDSLGRLAGGVAHDFNNLLTAIVGNAHLAQVQLAKGQPANDELREIERTGARAAALTKQLLAFARRERIEPVLFDLSARIAALRGYLTRLCGAQVHFTLEVPPAPMRLRADPDRMDQAVINLVTNAVDSLPYGVGRVSVHLRHSPEPAEGAGHVVLSVEDNGAGMPEPVRARISEPYFTTTRHDRGTGLGLSIVYGAVTQAGGRIEVTSAPDAGTRFDITLPLAESIEVSLDAVAEASAKLSVEGLRVLVVDDDPLVRRVAVRLLSKHGLAIEQAGDAEEAMVLHSTLPPISLLLTDVMMPGASGRALARRLIERQPGLAVVYMSGYDADAVLDEPLAPEGPFIAKPFTEAQFMSGIRRALAATAASAEGVGT